MTTPEPSSGIAPSRRTVVRGAAWSVPVVAAATAAPAFAASTCANPVTYSLNWGSTPYAHPATSPNASYATVTSGSSTIYVHFNTVFQGSGAGDGTLATGEARNLSVPSGTAGTDALRDPAITNLGGLGQGEQGVRLQQVSPRGIANRQDLTVSFRTGSATDSPLATNIQGLSFYIVDIDNFANPPYSDRVAFSASAAYTPTPDPNVVGAGTTGAETTNAVGPWRFSGAGNQSENASGARVKIQFLDDYSARMSQFTVSYWTATGAATGTGQYHRIYLSDMTFKTCP